MSPNQRRIVSTVATLVCLVAGVAVFRTMRGTEPAPAGLAPLAVPPDTARSAGSAAGQAPVDKPVPLDASEEAMSASLITKAQAKLKQEGLYHGEVDGTWSRDLNRAIKTYQQRHGLRVSGILDGYTRAALGI